MQRAVGPPSAPDAPTASRLYPLSNVTGYWWGSCVRLYWFIERCINLLAPTTSSYCSHTPQPRHHLPSLIWLCFLLLPCTRPSSDWDCSRKYLMHVLWPESKDLRSNKHRQYFTALPRFIDVTELLYCPRTTSFVSLPWLRQQIKRLYVCFSLIYYPVIASLENR